MYPTQGKNLRFKLNLADRPGWMAVEAIRGAGIGRGMSTISALVDPYSLRTPSAGATHAPACMPPLFVTSTGPVRADSAAGSHRRDTWRRDAADESRAGCREEVGAAALARRGEASHPLRCSGTAIRRWSRRSKRGILQSWPRPSASASTPAEEATDPAAADELYDAANAARLITRSREAEKFQSLFADNITYTGFARNLLGLRLWVFACCVIALVAIALAYFTPILFPAGLTTTTAILATGIISDLRALVCGCGKPRLG